MSLLAALTGDIALVLVSLAAWLMIVALDRGELRRGNGFGLRTAATTSSDEAWAAGHAAARPELRRLAGHALVAALPPLLAAAVLGGRFPLGAQTVTLLLLVAAYAFVGVRLVRTCRVADAAARAETIGTPAVGPEATGQDAPAAAPAERADTDAPRPAGAVTGEALAS